MGIDEVKPFQVKIYKKVGLVDIALGTKPLWATYTGADGQVRNFAIRPGSEPYLTAFNAFSTAENPNITPQEAFQIKVQLAKQTEGTKYVPKTNLSSPSTDFVLSKDSIERNDFFGLLNLYSDENSDGGKDITPKEQAEIMDIYTKWYNKE